MKISKLSLAVKITIAVFIVEFFIMIFMHRVTLLKANMLIEALVDAFILASIIALIIYFTFYRPLKKIFETMEEIKKGRLDIRLDILREDEVGIVAQHVNHMISGLESYYKKVEETDRLLTNITDGIDEAIMLIDTNHKILWANKKIKELSHLEGKDIIGNYCYKVTHHRDEPCNSPEDICPINEVINKGKRVNVLHTHYDKENNPFYVEVSVYPVKCGPAGSPSQFIHIARDVTERIHMIEDLKTAKTRLEEYSQVLERTVEQRTKELVKSVKELEKQKSATLNILEDVSEARNELVRVNEELRRTEGQLIQSAKMAAVGQLASGVAHEINNPLTVVLNNAQLFDMQLEQKNSFTLEEVKEIMEMIKKAALRAVRITQLLLNFSHISTDKFSPLSVNELIEKVMLFTEHGMKIKNIIVNKELQSELPKIKGNEQLLEQVLLNLISNASWAIEKKKNPGGRSIIVKTQREGENYVSIIITDTGIGIPKENMDRIFEPFFTTKAVGEGTGLGLSMVYNIINKHKGTVSVESEEGRGTIFKINLPIA